MSLCIHIYSIRISACSFNLIHSKLCVIYFLILFIGITWKWKSTINSTCHIWNMNIEFCFLFSFVNCVYNAKIERMPYHVQNNRNYIDIYREIEWRTKWTSFWILEALNNFYCEYIVYWSHTDIGYMLVNFHFRKPSNFDIVL